MKKYLFSIIFLLGCFFMTLGLSFNTVYAVDDVNVRNITGDTRNSRLITIQADNLLESTKSISVSEIEYCPYASESECTEYNLTRARKVNGSTQDVRYRIIDNTTTIYTEFELKDTSVELKYEISTQNDGIKHFLLDSSNLQGIDYYSFFDYTLSTLQERIVINPDGEGRPMNIYDGIQYSSVRQIEVLVNLIESDSGYTGNAKICEYLNETETNCITENVSTNENIVNYYILSYGDGKKELRIYLETTNNQEELISERDLYLDTIGPEIVIEGGTWQFIHAGETYKEQKATCQDSVFKDYPCTVTNDLNVVNIRYDTEEYQIVTYEASDVLGNIRTVAVKIKAELPKEKSNSYIYIPIIISAVVVVGLAFGWAYIKRKASKNKSNYI